MTRSVGLTELQRRAAAAVCLIDGCSAEQAEAAIAKAEDDLSSRGHSLWQPSDPDAVEYAVGKALRVRSVLRINGTPRLRVLKGGAL
jgi:hypothetical protein